MAPRDIESKESTSAADATGARRSGQGRPMRRRCRWGRHARIPITIAKTRDKPPGGVHPNVRGPILRCHGAQHLAYLLCPSPHCREVVERPTMKISNDIERVDVEETCFGGSLRRGMPSLACHGRPGAVPRTPGAHCRRYTSRTHTGRRRVPQDQPAECTTRRRAADRRRAHSVESLAVRQTL